MLIKSDQNKERGLVLRIRCIDCAFFKSRNSPQYGEPCKNMGIDGTSKVCDMFSPNMEKVCSRGVAPVKILSELTRVCSTSDIRVLSFLLNTVTTVRKRGYDFGMPVYFNLSSPVVEYVNAYYKGYVYTCDDTYVYIVGSLEENNVFLTLPHESILTRKQFKQKVKELEKIGQVNMPKRVAKSSGLRMVLPAPKPSDFDGHDLDVPTIDMFNSQYGAEGTTPFRITDGFDNVPKPTSTAKKKKTKKKVNFVDEWDAPKKRKPKLSSNVRITRV